MSYQGMTKAELEARLDEIGVGHPKKATKAELIELLEQEESPIEVEAVAIDGEIVAADALSIDAEAMGAALSALSASVDDARAALDEYDVDDGIMHAMRVADVRTCEDGIAAVLRDVDERRKELTRMLAEPKKRVDDECKKVTEPLKAVAARYAEVREALYMEGYEAQYQECCIANGMEQMTAAVPFARFFAMHPTWGRRNANPVKVQEAISDEVERVARDWATLRRMTLRYPDDAEGEFFATLDLQEAIRADERKAAQQDNLERMRREREEAERWRAEQSAMTAAERALSAAERANPVANAPEPATVAERPAEPAPAPQGRMDGRRRYHFEVWMTESELASFREWKNACGVGEGWTFREVR